MAFNMGFVKTVSKSITAFMALVFVISVLSGCTKKTSAEHITSANEAIAQKDFATASIELKNAIRIEPNNAEIRFLLGNVYLETRQFAAAEKELEKALEFEYPANDVIPLLSKIYQRQGEDKNLFKLTAKAKGLKPKELAQLKLYQVQAYVRKGQNEKAASLIEELKGVRQGAEFTQLAFVYDLIIKNNLDAAIVHTQGILDKFPNQPDALKLKAQLYLQAAEPLKAAEAFSVYIEQFPEEVDVQFDLARLYNQLNMPEKAEPLVDDLLKTYKQQPILLQLKSTARLAQKDFKGAQSYAEKALQLNLEDNPTRLIAGISSYFLKDYEKANGHLSLLAGVLSSNHPALRMLADSQLKLGMTLEANETVQQFDDISDADVSLLSGVGRALLREGEIKKAKTVLERQPDSVESAKALANIASLKLSLNDVSGIVDLESALSQMNDTGASTDLPKEAIELTLAQAYYSNKQYDKVLEIAEMWKASEETKLKGLLLAGKVLTQLNKNSEANDSYEKALTLKPNDAQIKFEILSLKDKTSVEQKEALLVDVKALLKQHPNFVPAIKLHYLLAKILKQPEQMLLHLDKQIAGTANAGNNTNLKLTAGLMSLLENDLDGAINYLTSAKGEMPASFWSQLAQAYIKKGQYEEATMLFQEWFDKQPNNPAAVVGMIKVHDSKGEYNQALKVSRQYLDVVGGQNVEVKLLHLYMLGKARQYAELKNGLAELPEAIQDLPFSKGLLGQTQLIEKNFTEAEKNLKLAYVVAPSPVNASMLYVATHQNSGAEVAERFLKQHIESNPSDEANLMRFAQMQNGKDPKSAQAYYQRIIRINNDNFVAHNNLANLLIDDGKLEKAYEHAQEAKRLKPKEPNILDTIGVIELRLGKHKEALVNLSASIDVFKGKEPETVYVNYIEALLANGEIKLAERKMADKPLKNANNQKRLQQLKTQYSL